MMKSGWSFLDREKWCYIVLRMLRQDSGTSNLGLGSSRII
jgi:hypothetical protein